MTRGKELIKVGWFPHSLTSLAVRSEHQLIGFLLIIQNLLESDVVPDLVMIFSTRSMVSHGTAYFPGFVGSKDQFKATIGALRDSEQTVYDSACE